MKYLNKKGQVMQNLGALGIGVVTLTILLAVTLLVSSQVKTQAITSAGSSSATNESVVWTYATATALAHSPNSMELSCSQVYHNSPAGIVEVDGSNYTCSTGGIVITNGTTVLINESVEVWYNYKDRSGAYNSTVTLANATTTIPAWVPLIVLVIIGGIILTLVAVFKR